MSRNKKKKTQVLTRRQPATAPAPENWTEEIPHPAFIEEKPSAPDSVLAPLLLTIADVCALLKISRMTLHRLEKNGGLPGRVMLGGQVRYHREKIERWIVEQCG